MKQNQKEENSRCYSLGRVGDVQIAQLYCDGFNSLKPKEKLLAYWLYKASFSGRLIAMLQSNPKTLEVRNALIDILRSEQVSKDKKEKIKDYLKKIWIHNGIYHDKTSEKFVLDLSREELMQAASSAGVYIDDLADLLLDASFEQYNCKKSGKDIIKESYNGYYVGVDFKEVEEWAGKGNEKHPLNSTVFKGPNGLEEWVWRAGDKKYSAGMYAKALNEINICLREAMKYASEEQRQALAFLIRYFETGNPEYFDNFNIVWVNCDIRVDFILGFIETYLDPRSAKGRYEGMVYMDNPEATKMMSKLADEIKYFESQMPWDDKYKNTEPKPLSLKVVDVIFSCGDSGPLMPIGINLPNSDKICEKYGSKSVLLKNVIDTYWKLSQKKILREFAWNQEEIDLEEKWGKLEGDLLTAMHEVLGHASGKVVCGKEPQEALANSYSTLEEARADLVALWLMLDPKLKELGIVSDQEALASVAYQSYIRNGGMTQLHIIPEADTIEQSHMKNRQLIVYYIMDNSDAIETRYRDGKTYFCLADIWKMRSAIGELLSEIMRIKSEGDFSAGMSLISKYGTKVNKKLQAEVVKRTKPLDIPKLTAFVMPKLVLKESEEVEISYISDLEDYMADIGDL